ncbi:hypothetical protein AVEN_152299-1 [Araneus ventricosus]|uniref:Uncharacterized protein n=1 Tax=Araneus ventricosus TaxID=182803 RepID=A0A4Y2VPP7_ARAVE|nr:hypothetical protein AVEN_152299-1 [Araneus ventricosus]
MRSEDRPRWPSGKGLGFRAGRFQFEPDSEDPAVYGACCTLNRVVAKRPHRWCGVEVWRGGASSGVILVID